jgi:hypothetical protein
MSTRSDLQGGAPPGPETVTIGSAVQIPSVQFVEPKAQSATVLHTPPIGTLQILLLQMRSDAHSVLLLQDDPIGLLTAVPVLNTNKNSITIIIMIKITTNTYIPVFAMF